MISDISSFNKSESISYKIKLLVFDYPESMMPPIIVKLCLVYVWQDLYLKRRYFISLLIWYPIKYMLECIFSVPSEIDRKGPEKHMEGPAQQAFEFNFFSPPFGLRIHLNSWTVIGLAFFALAAFVFLLWYCVCSRYCDVVESHHRNQGNQGRYVYNDPSPRFKAVWFFICEMFGEMFYLNL